MESDPKSDFDDPDERPVGFIHNQLADEHRKGSGLGHFSSVWKIIYGSGRDADNGCIRWNGWSFGFFFKWGIQCMPMGSYGSLGLRARTVAGGYFRIVCGSRPFQIVKVGFGSSDQDFQPRNRLCLRSRR